MSTEASQNGGSMASTNTNDDLNVFVAALGLTGNDRYIRDMEALADRAEEGIKKIAAMADQRVDNVVVRENYALSQLLEERFDDDVFPDVEYYSMDWRMFLDDPAEDGDNYSVEGVMMDDDVPVGQLMAAEHGVDASAFDLSDRDDRNDIDYRLLEQSRINRAKAKARGKTDERVYNDYFDTVTTATHAVFLHDGTDRGMEAITTARGTNPWVKFATELSGDYIDISANKDDDQILDWARYLVESSRSDVEVEDLTDGQVADLRARLSADDLEYLGLDPQAAPETEPEPDAAVAAEASEVSPAQAD